MNNPIEMIKAFMEKGGTPQQFVMNEMLCKNSNPIINNLMEIAKKGNNKSIENFARNMFKEQGRDFDKEFGEFVKQIKG